MPALLAALSDSGMPSVFQVLNGLPSSYDDVTIQLTNYLSVISHVNTKISKKFVNVNSPAKTLVRREVQINPRLQLLFQLLF